MKKRTIIKILLLALMFIGPNVSALTASEYKTKIDKILSEWEGKRFNDDVTSPYDGDTSYYGGATECLAFAKYTQYLLYGTYNSDKYTWLQTWDINSIYDLRVGDVIRYNTTPKYNHSIIIIDTDPTTNKVRIMDCNRNGHPDHVVRADYVDFSVIKSHLGTHLVGEESGLNSYLLREPGNTINTLKDLYIPSGSRQDLGANFLAQIRSKIHTNIALEGSGKSNASAVYLGTFGRSNKYQYWNFVRHSDGSYTIKNTYTDTCLDVSGDGNINGNNVYMWSCYNNSNGGSKNRWYIYKYNGGYRLVPQSGKANKLAIDVKDADYTLGKQLEIYEALHSTNGAQTFIIDILPTSITLDKTTAEIGEGESTNLSVNFESNVTEKTITWKSSNTTIATVDSNGKVTAKKEGTATITATTANGKTATCTFKVVNLIPEGHKIKLNYSKYQINTAEGTVQLKDQYIAGNKIKWESSNSKIATVDANGKVTAKKGGFVRIKASTDKYGSTECLIDVNLLRPLSDGSKAYPGDPTRDGVIDGDDAAVILDWYNRNLTEDEIAVGDVDADGVVTGDDAAVIQDWYKYNDGFKPGSYKRITSITLNKTNVTLEKNQTTTLSATTSPTDTTDSPKIKWKSSNTKVATVDTNGKVTAVGGGVATITAIADNGLGVSTTCKITVNEIVLNGMHKINNRWGYYVNNQQIKNYNGLATNENGTWKFTNGTIDFKTTGMYKSDKWYYVKDSKVVSDYNGLATNENGTWKFTNGTIDMKTTGMYKINNTWYYVRKSSVIKDYNGLATNENGTWKFTNGTIDFKTNMVYKFNNTDYYIRGSKVVYDGMYKINNTWRYISGGKVVPNYNGLATNENGTWKFTNGTIDMKTTGMYKINNTWYYVRKSSVIKDYNGLATNENGTWKFTNGTITFKYNGTYTDSNGKVYTIRNSKVIG